MSIVRKTFYLGVLLSLIMFTLKMAGTAAELSWLAVTSPVWFLLGLWGALRLLVHIENTPPRIRKG